MNPSRFMILAVHAYHRSERDCFARMGEAFDVCKAEDWPGASTRVRKDRMPSKLWFWACKRWGGDKFPRLEYDIREGRHKQ